MIYTKVMRTVTNILHDIHVYSYEEFCMISIQTAMNDSHEYRVDSYEKFCTSLYRLLWMIHIFAQAAKNDLYDIHTGCYE
jgi:hypothetical protein